MALQLKKFNYSRRVAGPWYKIRGRIEIQPRFKIQYPMKNHNKDAVLIAKRCMVIKKNINSIFTNDF
jgi:hypothetical protein